MVEGFLLQVTLPETEQLYKYLLYKLAPLPPSSAPSGKNKEQDQSSSRGSPHKKVTKKNGFMFRYSSYYNKSFITTSLHIYLDVE